MSARQLLHLLLLGFLAALGLPLCSSHAAAKDPPASLLTALDQEVEGETVVRAAEEIVGSYRDHPRAGDAAEVIADYHYMLGEYKTAAGRYDEAAKLSSGSAQVRRLLARGRSLLAARDFHGASGAFSDALRFGSRAAEARLGLADVAFGSGEAGRAVILYSEILDRSPSDPVAPLALAQRIQGLDAQGRSQEALVDARRLVEAYPRSTEAAAMRDRIRVDERSRSLGPLPTETTPPVATPRPAAPPPTAPREPETRTPTERPEAGEKQPVAGGYSLQFGAFSTEDNARDLGQKLEGLGLENVRVEEEQRGGRIFYRVRAGYYPDSETAEAEGNRLREAHGLRSQVVSQ